MMMMLSASRGAWMMTKAMRWPMPRHRLGVLTGQRPTAAAAMMMTVSLRGETLSLVPLLRGQPSGSAGRGAERRSRPPCMILSREASHR